MENIDQLKREIEEAKEQVRKDIEKVGEILGRMAEEARNGGKTRVEGAMQRAERRIEETTQRVERRIEKAIAMMTVSAIGAGSIVTKELDFSDFTNVEVDCTFKVEITHSDSYRVSITASEKLFDYINVTKSGNTLRISLRPFRFHVQSPLEARIAMPALNKLRLAGATKSVVSGFGSQEGFELNLCGASTLDIDMEAGEAKVEISGASRVRGNLRVGDAELVLSGASRAELNGSANNVILNAWGASKVDMADFTLQDMSVHLKGATQATINVNGKLDLDLSGASKLNYIGNPMMRDINVSGASTLNQK
jgi:hypothetical protein